MVPTYHRREGNLAGLGGPRKRAAKSMQPPLGLSDAHMPLVVAQISPVGKISAPWQMRCFPELPIRFASMPQDRYSDSDAALVKEFPSHE